MVYKLVLRPEVEGDIEHAYNWYEDQKEGLGEEFLSELVIYYKKWRALRLPSVRLRKTIDKLL